MRQPEPNRDSEAFLSALADELSIPPGDLLAREHITAAARIARPRLGPDALRWVAAAMVVFALLGTGGIAAAGGLPRPVQDFVADVARSLPVPLQVPYPEPESSQTTTTARSPLDGEVDVEAHVPTPLPSEAVGTSETDSEPEIEKPGASVSPGPDEEDRDCGHRRPWGSWEDWQGRDRDRGRELREAIGASCGVEMVAPPGFTSDQEDGERGSDHRLDDDRDGGGDHEDDTSDGRASERREDRDSDSSEDWRSDESETTDRDGQEDRHDGDQDEDDESGDRWGDGRD